MKYVIKEMNHNLEFIKDNKKISLPGFAILDEIGLCFMIVYGEDKKDLMINYLNEQNF
jgi:hypothetical protein